MKVFDRLIQIAMVVLFLGFILFPWMNNKLHIVEEYAGNENRARAKKPEFNINKLDQYTKAYDDYFTDNFSLRQNLIRNYNHLQVSWFKSSPLKEKVLIGKNGWYFHAENVSRYDGSQLFSNAEIDYLKKEFSFRTKWFNDQGIQYILVPVPSKMHIYPENLPNYVQKKGAQNKYDQLLEIANAANINMIDIRANILENKSKHEHALYQKTDGHWNDLGAYYGYEEIMNKLAEQLGDELLPRPMTDFSLKIHQKMGSLTKMINLEEEVPEQYVGVVPNFEYPVKAGELRDYPHSERVSAESAQIVKVNNGKSYKCIVIRDSYTVQLIDILSERFKETLFIHDAWTYQVNEDIVLKEKPDVVLCIFYAGFADNLLENSFQDSEIFKGSSKTE